MQFTSLTREHVTELHYNIAEGIAISQGSLHLCRQSASTFEQEHVFPHVTSCSPSSVTTGTRHSAVCHWCNGILAGSFSKDQTGDNLMVWGQDCRENAAGNIMVAGFWVEGSALVNFLSRMTTVKSNHYIETPRSLYACLQLVYLTRKISEVSVAPPWC